MAKNAKDFLCQITFPGRAASAASAARALAAFLSMPKSLAYAGVRHLKINLLLKGLISHKNPAFKRLNRPVD